MFIFSVSLIKTDHMEGIARVSVLPNNPDDRGIHVYFVSGAHFGASTSWTYKRAPSIKHFKIRSGFTLNIQFYSSPTPAPANPDPDSDFDPAWDELDKRSPSFMGEFSYTGADLEEDIIIRKWHTIRMKKHPIHTSPNGASDGAVLTRTASYVPPSRYPGSTSSSSYSKFSVCMQYNYRKRVKNLHLSDLTLVKHLGIGASGIVELMKYNKTGSLYAIKQCSKGYKFNQEVSDLSLPLILKERNNLVRCLTHVGSENSKDHNRRLKFLVNIQFAFQTWNNCYMGIDYVPSGDLHYYLNKLHHFNEFESKFYLCEIISGLTCLHDSGIILRDLKPENILIGLEGHIKICDLGLSTSISIPSNSSGTSVERSSSMCGTSEYLAPEMIDAYYGRKQGYRFSIDIWSLGIVFYEMLFGFTPFVEQRQPLNQAAVINGNQNNNQNNGFNNNVLFNKILQDSIKFPPQFQQFNISRQCLQFILDLLNKNPQERIGSDKGASSLIKHSYLKTVNWLKLENLQIDAPSRIIDLSSKKSKDLSSSILMDQVIVKEFITRNGTIHHKNGINSKDHVNEKISGKILDENASVRMGEKGRREHFAGFSFINFLNPDFS